MSTEPLSAATRQAVADALRGALNTVIVERRPKYLSDTVGTLVDADRNEGFLALADAAIATLDAARASRPEPAADLAGLLHEAFGALMHDGCGGTHAIGYGYCQVFAEWLAARGVTVSPDLVTAAQAVVDEYKAMGIDRDRFDFAVVDALLAALPASPAPKEPTE
jgi:hypothetical protein